jgi:4'-phosphopantetheinyl transferase
MLELERPFCDKTSGFLSDLARDHTSDPILAVLIIAEERGLQITVSHPPADWLVNPATPLPEVSELQIWGFPLAVSESAFAHCSSTLSEDEQQRASRFHFERDSRRFVVARGSMRSILSGYVRTAAHELRFMYSEHGKPSLAQNLMDVRFNLSHAGDRAILGVTRGQDVGVDIELIRNDVEHEKLAQRFFSAQEHRELSMLSAGERLRGFYRCWTCKEAFLKAQGFGLTRNLDSFDVDLRSGPARLVATRPDPSETERWQLLEVETASGYAAAAATNGPISKLSFFRCDGE